MTRDERGGATLLAVAMSGVLLLLGTALALAVGVVGAHRHAQSAADLAALGAAGALVAGRDACAAGAEVAAANDARLVGCAVAGRSVRVQVQADGPSWGDLGVDPVAEARAGQE